MEPISREVFCKRTELRSNDIETYWQNAGKVVSPHDLVSVLSCMDMPKRPYLVRLLEGIPTVGDSSCRPYLMSPKFDLECTDLQHVRAGQTFVQNDKLLALLDKDGLKRLFWSFTGSRGIGRYTAKILLGTTADGEKAVAHYLPPILEEHGGEYGTVKIAVDGTHRSLFCLNAGQPSEAIIVRQVTIPFPCNPHRWDEIKRVAVKPPRNERYDNLNPELFRDLKYVGIDG